MGSSIDAITKANEEFVETVRRSFEATQRQGAGLLEAAALAGERVAPAGARSFERALEAIQEGLEAARGASEAWLAGNIYGPDGALSPQLQAASDRYATAFTAFLRELGDFGGAVREASAGLTRRAIEAQLAALSAAEEVAQGYERLGGVVLENWQSAARELRESIPGGEPTATVEPLP